MVKTSPKVAAQCKSVEKLIKECGDDIVPANFRSVLAAACKETLSTMKADRHPFQQKFASMISQAVKKHGEALKKAAEAAQGVAAQGAGLKAERASALEAATADLASKAEVTASAKKAKEDAAAGFKAAKAAVKDAEHAQTAAEKSLPEARARLEKYTTFKGEALGPLTEDTAEKDVAKKSISTLKSIGRECEFDGFLMDHLPTAFGPPAERSTFDSYAIKSFGAELEQAIKNLTAEVANAEGSKANLDANVEHAKAAFTAAEGQVTATEAALSDAVAAEKTSSENKKAAQHANDNCDKDAAKAASEAEDTKKAVADYEEGAAKANQALQTATDKTPGYYEVRDGVHLDRAIVNFAKGQINMEMATALVALIAASGDYTKVERWSVRYIFGTCAMSEEVADFINAEVAKLPQPDADEQPVKKRKVGGYYMTIDGVKCDSGIINACNDAVKGVGDGRVSVEDAKKILEKAMDGGKITETERWTLLFCILEYKWTSAAIEYFVTELKKAQGGQ